VCANLWPSGGSRAQQDRRCTLGEKVTTFPKASSRFLADISMSCSRGADKRYSSTNSCAAPAASAGAGAAAAGNSAAWLTCLLGPRLWVHPAAPLTEQAWIYEVWWGWRMWSISGNRNLAKICIMWHLVAGLDLGPSSLQWRSIHSTC